MASTKLKLKLPARDLSGFRLFHPNREGAASWLAGLPESDYDVFVDETSHALELLNRSPVAPRDRFEILETLRPRIAATLHALARDYLQQPVRLTERAQRQAERAERLSTLLGTAYTIAAIDTAREPEAVQGVAPAQLACEAIHRALFCAGQQVVQALQLYRPLHLNGWLNLHQLYALAEQQHLTRLPVPDPAGGGADIRAAYLQAILLGCSNPHKLRQPDLATLFTALGEWANLVELDEQPDSPGPFLVDLNADQPPLYRQFYAGNRDGERRYIDTGPLVERLRELREQSSGTGIERSSRLPAGTLDHLITALGTVPNRATSRSRSGGEVTVALGLGNSHYYMANHRTFDEVLYGEESAAGPQQTRPYFSATHPATDVWHQANPAEDFLQSPITDPEQAIDLDEITHARLFRDQRLAETEVIDTAFPSYQAKLSDVSPGGYCLAWEGDIPDDLHIGDVICIREAHADHWSLGAVRWLTRVTRDRILTGLELLSPRAVAFGARIHEITGEQTAPVRALLLPEISVVGQAATLLTPRAGFHEEQKVTLVNFREQVTVLLTRVVESTGVYSRFEFRVLRELGDLLAQDDALLKPRNELSLWEKA